MCGFFNAKNMKERSIDNASNFSPLDEIQSVMCAPPGTESVLGLTMPPHISLFETISDAKDVISSANREHVGMQNELKKRGIEVINMRELIGTELAKKDNAFKSPEQLLGELKDRATLLHNRWKNEYKLGKIEDIHNELELLLNEDRKTMGDDVAIAINAALCNCTDINGNYKKFQSGIRPAANFLFWRDTNHITGNQVAVHKMYYSIRQQEVILAEIGLRALGIDYQKMNLPKGSIEGGDVMPIEINGQRYAFIGRAQRTSDEGVDEWFRTHEDLWEQSGEGLIPVVVEGPRRKTQDHMHLDTYFQQINKDSCIHCGDRTGIRDIKLLMRKGSEIVRVDTTKFNDWIEKNFTYSFNMTKDEQLNYAPNVLVDGGRTVYITRSGTPRVTDFIKERVAETVMLGLEHLTELYGGVHCSTSEIRIAG